MFPSLTSQGKVAVSMQPDGNCLFRALADQIFADQDQQSEVRQTIVQFITDNQDDYKDLVPLADIQGNRHQNLSPGLDDYLRVLAKNGVWGGELEIHAAARCFGMCIIVHQEDGTFRSYNENIDSATATIGFSQRLRHYYSTKLQASNTVDNLDTITSSVVLASSPTDVGLFPCGATASTTHKVYDFELEIHSDPSRKSKKSRSRDKLPRKQWSKSATATLVRMKRDGRSWNEIAAAFHGRTLAALETHWHKQKVRKYYHPIAFIY